jgi:hypothetical protein
MGPHPEKPADHRLVEEVVRLIRAESQYRSVVRRVLAAERLYSKETAEAPERRVMRRFTAKMLFYAAIDKGAAFRTVERRFRETLSLSRDDLHSVVAANINFAHYCGGQGKAGVGIRRLERLKAELDRSENSAPRSLLANCRVEVMKLLRRLRKGPNQATL